MDNHSTHRMLFSDFIQKHPLIAQTVERLTGQTCSVDMQDNVLVYYITQSIELNAICRTEHFVFKRLLIVIAVGITLTLHPNEIFMNGLVDIILLRDACCKYTQHVNSLLEQKTSFFLDIHAQVSATFYALRINNVALWLNLYAIGEGSEATIKVVCIGAANQKISIKSVQHHKGSGALTNIFIKGLVCQQSFAIVEGIIIIDADTPRSQAFLEHRFLRLGKECTVESKPVLEITHNQVRCSHASSIGDIDPMHVWYLESRGLSHTYAQRLLLEAFITHDFLFKKEIVEKINSLKLL